MAAEATGDDSPGRSSIHKQVEQAVFYMWNNQYEEANKILTPKKDSNPRIALEWSNVHFVKGLMTQSNEQRESMLVHFQAADHLASACKYGDSMAPESDDEETLSELESIGKSAEEDAEKLTEAERKKIEKARDEKKAKDKEEYKKKKKEAEKSGKQVDQTWKLECDVIYADCMLVRSIAQLTMNCYFRGGINLRKTWGLYLTLMKQVDSDKTIPTEIVHNIKCGCGVFYSYLALVPAGLMRVLSAIGFISDKELGEQYLTEVSLAESIRSPFASLALCTYYLFLPTGLGNVEETLSKAKAILDRMNVKYPQNSYFNGYSNFYHRKRGETEEAVSAIILAARNAEAAHACPVLLRYLLADTLYMDLRWAEARDKYKELLDMLQETGESFAYTGQVVLSLAATYVMLEDMDKAMEWVKRVESMYNPKSKQDANSPKFAARVIQEPRLLPLIGVYVLYINRDLAHMKKPHVERLNEELERVLKGKDTSANEVKAFQLLFVGVMFKGCQRTEEALRTLQTVQGMEKKLGNNSLVLPYTYYELGELEYKMGNLQQARRLFEVGSELKGDGHETLANRYNIAMKQLKREMKEKGLEK